MGASFGSLRGTLFHIVFGERRWLEFFLHASPGPEADPDFFPDVASLEAAWFGVEELERTFAARLTDDMLAEPRRVRDREYTLAELVQHALNHATYHRGQVALLLRQSGETPPATDYRVYLDEAR